MSFSNPYLCCPLRTKYRSLQGGPAWGIMSQESTSCPPEGRGQHASRSCIGWAAKQGVVGTRPQLLAFTGPRQGESFFQWQPVAPLHPGGPTALNQQLQKWYG